jgi:tetratricopeptide (TPR) repeat protein
MWATLLILPALLVLSLLATDALMLLPLLAVTAMLIAGNWRMKRMRDLERQTLRVQELAMLRRSVESLRLGWDLLPRLTHAPPLHGRVVASLAHNLDQLRCFEAAIGAYDYLLAHLSPQDPVAMQFQVLRSIAQLATDRLTDADDALRRLRGAIGDFKHTAIAAAYRMAQLVQQIRTHHWEQAIQDSANLLADLRPLGVQAGYGHAMIALAYHEQAAHARIPAPEDVKVWWSRATLLLAPAALVERFPELHPLTESKAIG